MFTENISRITLHLQICKKFLPQNFPTIWHIHTYRNHHTSCDCCVVLSCMLIQAAAVMHGSTHPQCLQHIGPKHRQWSPCNTGGVNKMAALTFRLPSMQCPRWLPCVLASLRSSHTLHRHSTELNRGNHIRYACTCVECSGIDKLTLN